MLRRLIACTAHEFYRDILHGYGMCDEVSLFFDVAWDICYMYLSVRFTHVYHTYNEAWLLLSSRMGRMLHVTYLHLHTSYAYRRPSVIVTPLDT